jgi:hypothetical protein
MQHAWGEEENAYRVFVEKPLGTSKCRWEDNIKMDLIELGWGGMDWIHLVQERNL